MPPTSRPRHGLVRDSQSDARTTHEPPKSAGSSDHDVTTNAESQVKGHGSAMSGTDNHTPQQPEPYMPTPARGYSWAPFERGNTVAATHGGYSAALIAEDARDLAVQLVEAAPELAAPRYQLELESYCQLVAARRRLARSIANTPEGQEVPLRRYETMATLANSALKSARDFGLTPAGHALLASVVTGTEIGQVTLADLAAQGRQTRGYQEHISDEAEA